MHTYNVYVKKTVVVINGDSWSITSGGYLLVSRGGQVLAAFAAGKWERIVDSTVAAHS